MEPTTDNDTEDATNDNAQAVATDTDKNDKAERKRQRQAERDKAKSDKARDKATRRKFKRDKRQATKKALMLVAGNDINTVATWLLFFVVTLVAIANGILSSVGLYHYGNKVQGLPPQLAILEPVSVEGMTVAAIAAIYILRHAGFWTRLYCWLVFGVAVGASVAGNIAHVAYTDDKKGVALVFAVGAAIQPVFLTLSTHLLIVAMRHAEFATTMRAIMFPDAAPVATSDSDKPETDSDTAMEATPKATATPPGNWQPPRDSDRKPRQRQATTPYDKHREYATLRATEGATISDIHAEIVKKWSDPGRRNIERWTKPIRDKDTKATTP